VGVVRGSARPAGVRADGAAGLRRRHRGLLPGCSQGGGKVAACLRANEAKLSPGCKQGMAKMAGMMKEVVGACEDDMHRFCAGAAPGTARECLRTNFRELSMPCKRELFEAKKAM